MDLKILKQKFNEIYGKGEMRTFFSPGRINLIGEHIDYSGGYVFPCALDFGTYGLVREREDRKVNLASTNFDLNVCIDLDDIKYKKEDDWTNYPKGIFKIMMEKGYQVKGMDILVSGNIPNGAGLSSSASLETLIGEIVNCLFNDRKIDKIDIVKISQKAENEFVGVNCGIMDQFACEMGKKDKAVLLDCNTLNYEYADVKLGDYILVIMNTNKRRALNESRYNERRSECDKALQIIKKYKNIDSLCELSVEEFNSIEKYIDDKAIRKRAKHAVYENERVKEAFDSLNKGDLLKFGKLLSDSHNSLRDLYEVTGIELDTITDEAIKTKGCIGSRMTGAGFGGCAIALVLKKEVNNFINKVKENYKFKIGYEPSFYLSGIGDGTKEVNE